MNGPPPRPIRNRLLRAFPRGALDELRADLSLVELPRGARIELPSAHAPSAYFLEEGAVSIMIDVGEHRFELALVGREGMLGIPSLLGTAGARCGAVVVLACKAYTVPVTVFHRFLREQTAARGITLRFAQAQVTQLAHNSFANSHLTTLKRVARWLLMAHDRNDGDTLMIAQATLSACLGLHRPRVTEALHRLGEIGAIRSERAVVRIADRAKLIATVGASYGPAERIYDSLIGAQADGAFGAETSQNGEGPDPARRSTEPCRNGAARVPQRDPEPPAAKRRPAASMQPRSGGIDRAGSRG